MNEKKKHTTTTNNMPHLLVADHCCRCFPPGQCSYCYITQHCCCYCCQQSITCRRGQVEAAGIGNGSSSGNMSKVVNVYHRLEYLVSRCCCCCCHCDSSAVFVACYRSILRSPGLEQRSSTTAASLFVVICSCCNAACRLKDVQQQPVAVVILAACVIVAHTIYVVTHALQATVSGCLYPLNCCSNSSVATTTSMYNCE